MFGHLTPTGHSAVYLDGVCAVSPTVLRRCEPGETGVVISRYHKIGGYDWIAIPLVPYLYAVETAQEIPQSVDPKAVDRLRNAYRRENLRSLAPDDPYGRSPGGEWVELVGSAYDRRIYGFQFATTREQDDTFVEEFNHRENKSRFNFFTRNCADFARTVINFYFPNAVRRGFLADGGIMTPKHVAKAFVAYLKKHREVQLASFVIPQMPGSVSRSRSPHGVVEALLKTKRYLIPLAILHPWVTGGLLVVYLLEGRFNPRHHAVELDLTRMSQLPPAGGGISALVASKSPRRAALAFASKPVE